MITFCYIIFVTKYMCIYSIEYKLHYDDNMALHYIFRIINVHLVTVYMCKIMNCPPIV